MKTAIISGCNNNYFKQFLNLYNSLIGNNCLEKADLCFLDISVSEDNLKKISEKVSKIVKPKWDFNLKYETQDWKKILTVRPFLKEYFPGYDTYIWLDADTWVQGSKFIDDFVSSSNIGKISIIPELDINYEVSRKKYSFEKIFHNFYKAKGWSYKNYKKYFDNNIDENLFQKPILNAGVYSIPKSNEIWDMWKNEYGKIIENSSNDYCLNMDQASLNKVIYDNLDQVNFFGSEYNYLIKNCLPIFDDENKYFCLRDYPYKKIQILHLTNMKFNDVYEITSKKGKKLKKKLTYEE